jgi:hypothetical protein
MAMGYLLFVRAGARPEVEISGGGAGSDAGAIEIRRNQISNATLSTIVRHCPMTPDAPSEGYVSLCSLILFALAACSTSNKSNATRQELMPLSAGAHSDRAGIGLGSPSGSAAITIDPRRSLAVTDDAILASFSFQAVMDQLASQANTGLSSLQLFQQWWAQEKSCPPIGRFPYDCPRAEGDQANDNPFLSPPTDASDTPIGLFNRFDLAPTDGSDLRRVSHRFRAQLFRDC